MGLRKGKPLHSTRKGKTWETTDQSQYFQYVQRYWEKLLNSQFITTLQENKKVMKNSQHSSLKRKSCQNNLISSFDTVTFIIMDKKEVEDEIALL